MLSKYKRRRWVFWVAVIPVYLLACVGSVLGMAVIGVAARIIITALTWGYNLLEGLL